MGKLIAVRAKMKSKRVSIPLDQVLKSLAREIEITPGTLDRLQTWLRSDDARYIGKVILVLLAAGALGATAIVAPGGASALVQLLKPLVRDRQRRHRIVQQLNRKELFATRFDDDGRVIINLTKQGKKVALLAHAEALALTQPKVWDKRWRLVLFDVPEKDRSGREVLRRKLRELGFWQVQKSAWLLPWPCEAELKLFRERYDLFEAIRIYTIPDSDEFREAHVKFFGR